MSRGNRYSGIARHVPLPIRVSVAEHASQRTAIQARSRAIARRASKSVSRNESPPRRANACGGSEIGGGRKTVIGTTAGPRYSNVRPSTRSLGPLNSAAVAPVLQGRRWDGTEGAVRAHVPVTVIEARARDITRLVNDVVARPTHAREGAS